MPEEVLLRMPTNGKNYKCQKMEELREMWHRFIVTGWTDGRTWNNVGN